MTELDWMLLGIWLCWGGLCYCIGGIHGLKKGEKIVRRMLDPDKVSTNKGEK